MDDEELRKAILLLVQAVKLFQVRALTANAGLSWVMNLPPTKRAALSPHEVQATLAGQRSIWEAAAENQAANLQSALAKPVDASLIFQLQYYASRLLDS